MFMNVKIEVVNKRIMRRYIITIIILSLVFGITHIHYYEPSGDSIYYFSISENMSESKQSSSSI